MNRPIAAFGAARPRAEFAGVAASGLVEAVDLHKHPEALASGWWALVADFEGSLTGWRFREVRHADARVSSPTSPDGGESGWQGPAPDMWRSSLDAAGYQGAVRAVRSAVRDGEVYQANICRVLSAPLGSRASEPDARALSQVLTRGNPAPHAGLIHIPRGAASHPAWVVSASPELFLSVRDGKVTSGPIKGTAETAAGLGEKDHAENLMITDLVRNDLQQVCRPGTVEVVDLCAIEHHPGLVHLVSRVTGELRSPLDPAGWARLFAATLPPASVSGAPKSSALRLIDRLEPVLRGPYCGAVGWVDADRGQAELAVGIRTFWWTAPDDGGPGTLHFGTGAGITWGSDPQAEWAETELKAARLVALASGDTDEDHGAGGRGRLES